MKECLIHSITTRRHKGEINGSQMVEMTLVGSAQPTTHDGLIAAAKHPSAKTKDGLSPPALAATLIARQIAVENPWWQ